MEKVMEKPSSRQRYLFIDVLRIVACMGVIIHHTMASVYQEVGPSATWFISFVIYFLTRFSVPVFVLISGFNLLDRQDDYKKSAKRVLNAALPLLMFSLMWYLYQWKTGMRPEIGVMDFISNVLQTPFSLAYWYMYMYIGLLVMTPFLQKLLSALDKRDCQILIGLSMLIYETWPIIEHWFPSLTYSKLVDFSLFEGYMCMMMIGYYIKKYVVPSKKLLYGSVIGLIACLTFNVVLTYQEYMIKGGQDFLFYSNAEFLPVVMEGICIFCIAMCLLENESQIQTSATKVIKVVSGCTMGIYYLADITMIRINSWNTYLRGLGLHPLLAIFIFQITVFAIDFAITFILKKIPLLKKFV